MAALILHYALVSVDGPAGPLAEKNKDLHSLFNVDTIIRKSFGVHVQNKACAGWAQLLW